MSIIFYDAIPEILFVQIVSNMEFGNVINLKKKF